MLKAKYVVSKTTENEFAYWFEFFVFRALIMTAKKHKRININVAITINQKSFFGSCEFINS